MGTTSHPLRVDESYFSGRRKYGRGRLANGDKICRKNGKDDELEDWKIMPHDGAVFNNDADDWVLVVGIYESREKVRFIRVQNRTQKTLRFFENNVEPGSVVWTDCRKGYNSYSLDGYTHQQVSHSEYFADPNAGVNMQGIERAWLDDKSWYKRARGNRTYLKYHLDEAAWRRLRSAEKSDGTLFQAFMKDLRTVSVLET